MPVLVVLDLFTRPNSAKANALLQYMAALLYKTA